MHPPHSRVGFVATMVFALTCAATAASAQPVDELPTPPAPAVQPVDEQPAPPPPRDYCLDEALARANDLSDLYCVNLVAIPMLTGASGFAKMIPTYSPFGVSVTRDGHHEYRLAFSIEGLPAPDALGPYTTYVAWVTTPLLTPMQKLGPVGNGTTVLDSVAFNKFLILITAEASPHVAERAGKIVMRGSSPSSRMEAHDLAQTAPLAVFTGPDIPASQTAHEHHGGTGGSWPMPPMHPVEPNVPGMAGIRPRVDPFEPGAAPAGGALMTAEAEDARPAAERKHVSLAGGKTFDLKSGFVTRRIDGKDLLMYGFNGQHPGPLLEVEQGTEATVRFTNGTDLQSAIHWHGLRLDVRFDGVPHMTQHPVAPGGSFTYRLAFPDAGIFWYHPHHREDIAMDLGLFANILVRSTKQDYFNPVHREELFMLDDLLLDDEGIVPYGRQSANFMLMGRFGNTFLINGRPDYSLDVRRGETVRFFVTNASSTRTYNLSLGETRLKLVGSDVGKFEREEWVDHLVIGPAERYIVEAHFPDSGLIAIENRVQAIDHLRGTFFPEVDTLGVIRVADEAADPDLTEGFDGLRVHEDVVSDIDAYRSQFDRPVDHHLTARLEVENLPAVVRQMMRFDNVYVNPVEWSGTMPMMNWATTGEEIRWILEDAHTGKQNMDIDWNFEVGDVVKIRLTNDRNAFHAMQHPIHIHGQRFLVLERDGVAVPNLVWKDTMILPAGSTADILLELSNPGNWMVHCHIAEHIDSGMMFVIDVN